MSASKTPTFKPSFCKASARFTVVVDLPTPPLPEDTKITFWIRGCFGTSRCCGAAFWMGGLFGSVSTGCAAAWAAEPEASITGGKLLFGAASFAWLEQLSPSACWCPQPPDFSLCPVFCWITCMFNSLIPHASSATAKSSWICCKSSASAGKVLMVICRILPCTFTWVMRSFNAWFELGKI